jgi:hypothetical protein
VEGRVKLAEYNRLVLYHAREVGDLQGLEDQLQDGDTDSETWAMELLRELGCRYSCLTQGGVGDRLSDKRSKLVLTTPALFHIYVLLRYFNLRIISN